MRPLVTFSHAVALLGMTLLSGCSWESVQRTGYESIESMRQKQCLDRLEDDCSLDRTRYDDYQTQRQLLQEQEP